jgi:hypothetical protein
VGVLAVLALAVMAVPELVLGAEKPGETIQGDIVATRLMRRLGVVRVVGGA